QVTGGIHPELAKMPKKGDPLTAGQIGLLRAWIDQGAVWPAKAVVAATGVKSHWAFSAPVRPSLPVVKNKKWVRNEIDRFILAKLERENLKPSPEADKITLIRRASLDLIGLPPSVAEVDAFLADKSPNAYEKVVDRLLQSPHYGERWGRHWLDAARYADSDGYEKDKSRQVWFYRDYVVKAFNQDIPYDQFIIEQLAGDQLPDATQDQIVATGFLRNSMLNEEGAIDPEQFRMEAMFDRMDAIGKSMLGLTIQCAQCHTHKFDPVTQEEYYRLFAFINNDHEASKIVYLPEEQMKIANLTREMAELEANLRHTTPDWEERMAKWEESVRNDQPQWTPVHVERVGDNDQGYYPQKDESQLAAGYAPTYLTESWRTTNSMASVGSFRLELLNDPSLPWTGPGRSFMGTCALTEFKVEAADAANPTNKIKVKLVKATADYSNPRRDLEINFDDQNGNKRVTGPVDYAIDDKNDTAWGIDAGPGRRNQPRKAVFVPEKPVEFPAGAILTVTLVQNHGGWNSDDHMNNNLGRFRFSITPATNVVADPLPKRIREIVSSVPRDKRTPEQQAAVFACWRGTVADFRETNDKIEKLWAQWPAGSTALVLKSREDRRETAMLKRGDWLKPGKVVTAGVPAFLNQLPADYEPTRLTLAKWITDRKAPTTARVFMNRAWQEYFGTGLVPSPEDFGTRCEAPSHPELLDWLAVEFMEPTVDPGKPWAFKRMQRLIVTSATYRQSSRVGKELLEKDPYNRLLARSSRLRVDGEIVRDIALAASGLLNEKIGGPSIYSPAPEFLFQPPASYAPFPWKTETGENRYRRAFYTFRRRSTPYPMLASFDAPNGDFSCVRRARSNTPLQALTLLNEPVFVECAQALARKTLVEGGKSDEDRIEYAFRRTLSRPPAKDERKELLALLEKERKRSAEGWYNAREIATGKNEMPEKLPAGITPNQLAAYTVVSRVLLNLDETITKE
ncbi:MAG TPA: DUF1549 and DUF1553 domain-containing protein, partial [Verrucomicrobiae bacterium]|nr:DUF1549 and DUF1553 domain-containing protein [Verrucomicrobiae bacterium]